MGNDNDISTTIVEEKPLEPTVASSTEKDNEAQLHSPFWYTVHQFACFIWLAPAIALLYLNLSGYIIGASIGCFSCRLNPFSSSTHSQQSELDKKDHAAVGGLQFASKVMEIWFMIVAAGILYDLLILLTKPGKHLPLGMLAKYVQFADILGLAEIPPGDKTHSHRLFLVFVGFMCITVNLMGPSTAVLMIPTIQWVDTSFRSLGTFDGMASHQPPQKPTIGRDCTSDLLEAGNFSCTASPYEFSLDQLFASVEASLEQIGQTKIIFNPVISQEQQVSFIVNTTDADVDWIPSRQVAQEISNDYLRYADGLRGAEKHSNYSKLLNSLSTILVRDGPTIGLAGGCYHGPSSNVIISADKGVRCYGGWNLYSKEGESFVRCIRVGSGWAGPISHSQFFLQHEDKQKTSVDIYFANRVYTPIANNSPCFIDGKAQNAPGCDWDQVFLSDPPYEYLGNSSTNVILVEYKVPTTNATATSLGRTVWCDNIAYLGFQEYSMDPSPYSNFIHLAELDNGDPRVAPGTIPLVVNTDWILAGWSVDRGGTANESRIAVSTMIRLVQDAYADTADVLDLTTLNFMDGVVADLSLSMINYDINTTGTSKTSTNDLKSSNPTLLTNFKLHVWAYGLGSRTSYLGVTIVFVGVACVVFRLLVALLVIFERQGRYTTPTPLSGLIVSALSHVPEDPKRINEKEIRITMQKRTISFSHG